MDETVVQRVARVMEARRTPRDRSYAVEVDALIPKACKVADDRTGPPPRRLDAARREAWGQAWSRIFHATMDELTTRRGIRKQSHQA